MATLFSLESASAAVATEKSNWNGSSGLFCLPWVFSHAPLCDGASGMDVVDPFPRCALWLVHRIQQ